MRNNLTLGKYRPSPSQGKGHVHEQNRVSSCVAALRKNSFKKIAQADVNPWYLRRVRGGESSDYRHVVP